ncbi:hypothetical protein GIW81_06330 [Hyphomicrobium sp. xq]|uniref:Uncharacterized protein n=1 Tax=Hyphomicrobium album TaxID=2665159 RepID=A0A6I3KML3_9HYPH|nr:hypothetical protein [Hyphomicrobium album]MTD93951.1 hypothetical protein [Hyphomicrobium album]
MKAREFGETLSSFADLIEEEGSAGRATNLRLFAEAIATAGELPVSKVVPAIQKHWKSVKRTAEYPCALAGQLTRIGSVLAAAGAKANSDCSAVLKLLAGEQVEGAKSFAADIKSAILAPPPVKKRRAPQGHDATAIEKLADRLVRHRLDNAEFDATIAEIAGAKLKKPDLVAIAHRFLGSDRSFKTAADALKAIKNRQLQDALQASRDRRIEKIAV